MNVILTQAQEPEHTTYTLRATIEGQQYTVQRRIPANTYAALDVKDVRKFIESGLWAQLMDTIEYNLRKTMNA